MTTLFNPVRQANRVEAKANVQNVQRVTPVNGNEEAKEALYINFGVPFLYTNQEGAISKGFCNVPVKCNFAYCADVAVNAKDGDYFRKLKATQQALIARIQSVFDNLEEGNGVTLEDLKTVPEFSKFADKLTIEFRKPADNAEVATTTEDLLVDL